MGSEMCIRDSVSRLPVNLNVAHLASLVIAGLCWFCVFRQDRKLPRRTIAIYTVGSWLVLTPLIYLYWSIDDAGAIVAMLCVGTILAPVYLSLIRVIAESRRR